MAELEAIPHPRKVPLLGNLGEIRPGSVISDLNRLAGKLGPIYEIHLPGTRGIILSGHELVDQACDDRAFDKVPVERLRAFLQDGLFTAWTEEPAWRRGHRIIAPAFGTRAVRGMYATMLDPIEQLCERLLRRNPGGDADVLSLTTSLSLETIGLTSFSYRFGNFYRDEPHPFASALDRVLELSVSGAGSGGIRGWARPRREREFREQLAVLHDFVDRLIADRRAVGCEAAGNDLLGHMLAGTDAETGERLSDAEVRYQALTLLAAGHESTSSALAFALYYLAADPALQARVRAQVDDVLGADPDRLPSYEQVQRLDQIEHVLHETLRLQPVAPMFLRYARGDVVLGGRWAVDKGTMLGVLLSALHRDPAAWGDDWDRFDPDRWRPERIRRLPPNAYKPFGTGARACIGQAFALQEAQLALAVILRRFEVQDPRGEELRLKVTISRKPRDLVLRFIPRSGVSSLGSRAASPVARGARAGERFAVRKPAGGSTERLLLLHGSDGGTAEALTRELAFAANGAGAGAEIKALSEVVAELPTDRPVAIVAASYNGEPGKEAANFTRWLQDAPSGVAAGVRFAVFGIGDHHWATTYQRIPALLDSELERVGGTRIVERGDGDAAGDLEAEFADWSERLLSELGALRPPSRRNGPGPRKRFSTEVVGAAPADGPAEAFGLGEALVRCNRELQRHTGEDPSTRSTRHLDLHLLDDEVGHRAGDHLLVLPQNLDAVVWQGCQALGVDRSLVVRLRREAAVDTPLPLDQPVSVATLLIRYLDLRAPATRSGIEILAGLMDDTGKRALLAELADDDDRYRAEVLDPRRSLTELAIDHPPDRPMPVDAVAEAFPLLRPRPYSIASSPTVDPSQVSLTVGLIDAPSAAGHGLYRGVTSAYLATRIESDRLLVRVRDGGPRFRLPDDPRTPVIMIAAGTGIAPFRGFLQERDSQRKNGVDVGPMLMFRGCRRSDHDRVYGDELDMLAAHGMLDLEEAFSREPGQPRVYVQDHIRERGADVLSMIERGARVLVCGDARTMAPEVRLAIAAIRAGATGATREEAERWVADLVDSGRYVEDIWGE